MYIKTSELEGAALDWAVARALGWEMRRVPSDIDGRNGGEALSPPDLGRGFQYPPRGKLGPEYFVRRWSTDWSQGGPLIESHSVWISDDYDNKRGPWEAQCKRHVESGPSVLIATMRAIVASEIGDEVDIPEELL